MTQAKEVARRDEYGDRIAVIKAYAPGDGQLSFVVQDPHTHEAVSPGPTEEECRAACPDGYEVYYDGPYFRARKTEALPFDFVTNVFDTKRLVGD